MELCTELHKYGNKTDHSDRIAWPVVHIDGMLSREKDILSMISKKQPDFIFILGDLVKWKGDYDAAMFFLSQLDAKIGVYAVLGDYDYSNSRNS